MAALTVVLEETAGARYPQLVQQNLREGVRLKEGWDYSLYPPICIQGTPSFRLL